MNELFVVVVVVVVVARLFTYQITLLSEQAEGFHPSLL